MNPAKGRRQVAVHADGMNGTREIPATVEPTPPALPTVTSSDAITPMAAIFNATEATVSA